MKKFAIIAAVASLGCLAANAQGAMEVPSFASNWSIGVDGGVATPLTHHAFFGNMRPTVCLHIQKQISPVFGLGVEGIFGINTSSWYGPKSKTAFDNSYVGAYGAVNLMNLFGGYDFKTRPFEIEAVAGAGWGHNYRAYASDWNYFETKAGLNFNFNVSEKVTLSLKPAVLWDMSDRGAEKSSASYNANRAAFNCQVGVTYHFNRGFKAVEVIDPAVVAALNADVNDLRAQLNKANADLAASQAKANNLNAQLQECLNRPVQTTVITENTETTYLNSVRYVFFKIGSSKITADQMPNVEMIASYLKNHPGSKVLVKGYASSDGNLEFNEKLAAARAEAVKTSLVKRYGIAADRIEAKGEGIGKMFEEQSWNRVSICTIEADGE